jgi:hypothetical protein
MDENLKKQLSKDPDWLLTYEYIANNIETITRCELWLEQLKKSAEATNAMFGTSISVDWRHDPKEQEGMTNGQISNSKSSGTV